jgi:hypothetical protein
MINIKKGRGTNQEVWAGPVWNSHLKLLPSSLENWSPWSDSHRRIRVYETRPVAAEAQGLSINWRSHVDSHHEPSPSQGEMQICYTLRAKTLTLDDGNSPVIRASSLVIPVRAWHPWPDSHRLGPD